MRASRRRTFILLTALGVACTDANPVDIQRVDLAQGTPVRWQAPVSFTAERTTAEGTVRLGSLYQVLAEGDAGAGQFTVGFWAVRGEARSLHITYDNSDFTAADPGQVSSSSYLRFEATDPTVRPDGTPIAVGDSVFITVTVNSADMVAHFAPSGLQFGTPSQLQMWYTGAQGDINSDGTADATDATIEETTLGIYYQGDGATSWTAHPDIVYSSVDEISALISHFSGYAISW